MFLAVLTVVPLVRACFSLGILWRSSLLAVRSVVVCVGYCYEAYKSAGVTLSSSRMQQNNTWEIRREVAKYRTNLEIMKMRIGSDRSSLFDENS